VRLKYAISGELRDWCGFRHPASTDLKKKRAKITFTLSDIGESQFRPFVTKAFFANKTMNDILTSFHCAYFGGDLSCKNQIIAFLCVYSSQPIAVMAVEKPFDYCMLKTGNGGTESVARWRYDSQGTREDNITDWALDQFAARYKNVKSSKRLITKDAIFNYVYAVLHNPAYREKYALNLKREFPRIPFYTDLWRWAKWGEELMALHVGYQTIEPWPLKRIDALDEKSRKAGLAPKVLLRADKDAGSIQLDSETLLTGVPAEAWMYKLGSVRRSNGFWTSTRKRRRKIPLSARSSTPIVSRITRRR
jgi:predicted helicase